MFTVSPALRAKLIQIFTFAVVGSIGACVDIGTVTLLTRSFGVHAIVAGTISTLLSVSLVFTLNKFVTFRSHGETTGRQLLKFAVVYGISIVLNIALYSFFVWLGIVPELAKAIAIIIGAFWNYLLSHGFVFRKVVGDEPVPAAI